MNKRKMADGQGTATAQRTESILAFPGVQGRPVVSREDPAIRPPTFLQARLRDLGVLEMAKDEPTRPPGFYVNYSQVLFYIAVLGAILGGFWFMYDRIAVANYEKGVKDTENKFLQRQLDDQKSRLEENERLLKMAVDPKPEKK